MPMGIFASLRVVCLSYPWFSPGCAASPAPSPPRPHGSADSRRSVLSTNRHPDPHGTTLRLLARVLKPLLAEPERPPEQPGGGTYGVFIDYCSMAQVPRNDRQEQLFRLALPGMSTLYSHPNTCVTPLSRAFFIAPTRQPSSRARAAGTYSRSRRCRPTTLRVSTSPGAGTAPTARSSPIKCSSEARTHNASRPPCACLSPA